MVTAKTFQSLWYSACMLCGEFSGQIGNNKRGGGGRDRIRAGVKLYSALAQL